MNKETLLQRIRIIDLIRQWFKDREFLEVDTPLMVRHPGMEPHLDPFTTELKDKDGSVLERRYLITSPELSMKKLLGVGFDRIFQLGKVFRNGEVSSEFGVGGSESLHHHEFTMLEWYRVGVGYEQMMEDCESLLRFIVKEFGVGSSESGEGSWEIPPRRAGGVRSSEFGEGSSEKGVPATAGRRSEEFKVAIMGDWRKLSVREAFLQFASMDLEKLKNVQDFQTEVRKRSYASAQDLSWDDLFFLVMLNEVEPALKELGPIFLTDYPASQAALAKKRDDNPFFAERFELYIDGVELCNAFSELCDPVEQRQRLEAEQEQRRQLGKEVFEIDEEFLQALGSITSAAGNALGVDRLVMLLLGKRSVREVMYL
ncbi:MAG: EF-P lysine aminoacylase EpmA [bacterium]|nr:EF-P lysine aminoacylase EpmA [bacterium]